MRLLRWCCWCLVTIGACLDGTSARTVVRVHISAPDTAALVGRSITLAVTAYDRVGDVVPASKVTWQSLDTARARVDSTGRVIVGPSPGDVLVVVATEGSGLGDTISLHAAEEGELKWTFAVVGAMNNLAGPALVASCSGEFSRWAALREPARI